MITYLDSTPFIVVCVHVTTDSGSGVFFDRKRQTFNGTYDEFVNILIVHTSQTDTN